MTHSISNNSRKIFTFKYFFRNGGHVRNKNANLQMNMQIKLQRNDCSNRDPFERNVLLGYIWHALLLPVIPFQRGSSTSYECDLATSIL